jgi:23S rRNA (uracil1939-C5)-methyltransferase
MRALDTSGLTPRPLGQGDCQSPDGKRCRLCLASHLDYRDELPLKDVVLRRFWKESIGRQDLDPLTASPHGRGYRTVTKRKAFRHGGKVRLGLIDPTERTSGGLFPVVHCAIEPPEHAGLYSTIELFLSSPRSREMTETLRYAIIKGSYDEFTVLLNVHTITATSIREANVLSKLLTAASGKVAGVFLLQGGSDDRYYIGGDEVPSGIRVRKLYGKPLLFQRVNGKPFLYPPVIFSQVNHSILHAFAEGALTLLNPSGNETFYDLYCGYGLFALLLAPRFRRVLGVEVSHDAIGAARENARRQKVRNARFSRLDVSGDTIHSIVEHASPDDMVLLDPPRNGTAEGVIEAIAGRGVRKVLHVFCNVEIIKDEVGRWEQTGYTLRRAVPFDMFPGTASAEVLVLLEPVAAVR